MALRRDFRLTFIKERRKSLKVTSGHSNCVASDRVLVCCHRSFLSCIRLPGNGLIPTVCCQDVMVPVRDNVAIILPALSLSLSLLPGRSEAC